MQLHNHLIKRANFHGQTPTLSTGDATSCHSIKGMGSHVVLSCCSFPGQKQVWGKMGLSLRPIQNVSSSVFSCTLISVVSLKPEQNLYLILSTDCLPALNTLRRPNKSNFSHADAFSAEPFTPSSYVSQQPPAPWSHGWLLITQPGYCLQDLQHPVSLDLFNPTPLGLLSEVTRHSAPALTVPQHHHEAEFHLALCLLKAATLLML